MFTIDLPQQIETRLLILAMSTGRTIEYCAREAILDYIDEIKERGIDYDALLRIDLAVSSVFSKANANPLSGFPLLSGPSSQPESVFRT